MPALPRNVADVKTAQLKALKSPVAVPDGLLPEEFVYQVSAHIRIGLTVNK